MYSYQYSEREDIFLSDSKIDKYSHALYKKIMKIAWEKLLGKIVGKKRQKSPLVTQGQSQMQASVCFAPITVVL